MKTQHIQTNSVDIYVEEHSRHGEAILFLHYQNGSTAMWHSVLPHFTDRYRVIALDLRGHGHSSQPVSGYDMKTQAEDLRGVLDALGIERAHFVGSSLGGDVATRLASLHPERVLSLSNAEAALQNFAGPDGQHEMSKEEFLALIDQRRFPEFADREAYERHMRSVWLPWNEVREAVVNATVLRETESGALTYKQTHEMRKEIIGDLYDTDLGDWYRDVKCPVLFLPCELEDGLEKKLRSIERFSAGLTKSKTVVIPGTSHLMPIDHANELATEVLAFLGEI